MIKLCFECNKEFPDNELFNVTNFDIFRKEYWIYDKKLNDSTHLCKFCRDFYQEKFDDCNSGGSWYQFRGHDGDKAWCSDPTPNENDIWYGEF